MIILKSRKLSYPVWLRGPFTLDSSSLSSLMHLMCLTRKYSLWHYAVATIKHVWKNCPWKREITELAQQHQKTKKKSPPHTHPQKLLQKNFSYRKVAMMSLPPAVLKARSVAKITVLCLDSTVSRDFAFQHPLWKLCLHEGHRSSHKYQVTEGRTDGDGKGAVREKHCKTKAKISLLGRAGKGKTHYPPCVTFTDVLICQRAR